MQKATFNQRANVTNPFQSDRKKVLTVCSAGLLRSPTMAEYLSNKCNCNVRACGTSQEYALIPISEALIRWADEIHVVREQEGVVLKHLHDLQLETKRVFTLNIPDTYEAFSLELFNIIDECYYLYYRD